MFNSLYTPRAGRSSATGRAVLARGVLASQVAAERAGGRAVLARGVLHVAAEQAGRAVLARGEVFFM